MVIRVYKDRVEEVEKRLIRLSKKAKRYGIPLAWEIGADELVEVSYRDDFDEEHKMSVIAVPVTVSDEMIRMGGWTAVAHLEHLPNGNVVTMFNREEIPEVFRTLDAHCDHCGTTRDRKFTYIVRNEDGELRQVGSHCLKDYTGIDPRMSAIWAEVVDMDATDEVRDWEHDCYAIRGWYVEEIIALAIDSIRERGYVRSDDDAPTKDAVRSMLAEGRHPSVEALAKAELVIRWVKGIEDGTGIERDMFPVVMSGVCSSRHFGRLVYLPVAFDKEMKRIADEEARRAAKSAERASSSFVGEVGDKVSFRAADAQYVTSFENQYGMTHLFKMLDEDGNVFVWYASRMSDMRPGMNVSGTIKAHKEYDGVCQTVLTRCKIA